MGCEASNPSEDIQDDQDFQDIRDIQDNQTSYFFQQIASINTVPGHDPELQFAETTLRKAFNAAEGNRIFIVTILGAFQRGKSSLLKFLTKNNHYQIGNGMNSQTHGIWIDGPYDLMTLVKLHQIIIPNWTPPQHVSFYFLDVEGFGANDIGDRLFMKLLAPFIAISAEIFILTELPEIKDTYERLQAILDISEVFSSQDATHLSFIIRQLTQRQYQKAANSFEDYETVAADLIQNWPGLKQFKGISSQILPMLGYGSQEFKQARQFLAQKCFMKLSELEKTSEVVGTAGPLLKLFQETGMRSGQFNLTIHRKTMSDQSMDEFVAQSKTNALNYIKTEVESELSKQHQWDLLGFRNFGQKMNLILQKGIDEFQNQLPERMKSSRRVQQSQDQLKIEIQSWMSQKIPSWLLTPNGSFFTMVMKPTIEKGVKDLMKDVGSGNYKKKFPTQEVQDKYITSIANELARNCIDTLGTWNLLTQLLDQQSLDYIHDQLRSRFKQVLLATIAEGLRTDMANKSRFFQICTTVAVALLLIL